MRLFDWRALLGDPLERRAAGRRLAPAVPGDWFIGPIRAVRADPLTTMLRWRQSLGDVVRLHFGGISAHVVFHPDAVRHVLQENARNYNKQTPGFDKIRDFLGNGLLTSEGAFWLRQRRIIQPAFHRHRLEAFAAVMARAADETAERWTPLAAEGASVDVNAEMMRLTLRIVGETLLSTDVASDATAVGAALAVVLEEARDRITRSFELPPAVPTPANRRLAAAMHTLDGVVERMIHERRRATTPAPDLLTLLIESRDDETGERMSDRQLRDEVMTIFLAGHETTANALTWTFYLLSKHPAAERALHAELRRVLAGRAPTHADLPQLPYTRAVVSESMRLFPPVWMLGRAAIDDDEVLGYHVPAGGLVFTCAFATHRHPDFWANPEGFDPERFAHDAASARPAYAYFPFGGGPRQCIGNNFALVETQLVLATLAQRFRLDLVPGQHVEPKPQITLRPRDGVRVTLRPQPAG
jgi:cytochrome P450